jgi:galactokinase/mevalonate kinase-like predicted kinase
MEAIRYSAPGRAGIIGNPSDMYGGSVISCAVPLRARCTLEPADHLTFQSPTRTLRPDTLALQGDEFDLCRAALTALGYSVERAPFTLRIESDIPVQSGLAGSSALLTAIVACLLHYRGSLPNPYHLAEQVRQIEAHQMQVTCGYQDFYMAVFGGIHAMEFRDKEGLGRNPNEPLAAVEPLGAYLRHSGAGRQRRDARYALVQVALENGALGAKLAGAGGDRRHHHRADAPARAHPERLARSRRPDYPDCPLRPRTHRLLRAGRLLLCGFTRAQAIQAKRG